MSPFRTRKMMAAIVLIDRLIAQPLSMILPFAQTMSAMALSFHISFINIFFLDKVQAHQSNFIIEIFDKVRPPFLSC